MAANPRTRTSMLRALKSLAEAGTCYISAASVAHRAGLTKATAQRFGREHSPLDIGGKWTVVYADGMFSLRKKAPPREPEPVVAPDWFELPTDLAAKRRHSTFDIGQRRELAYAFVEQCIAGEIALAPWQRGSVWTEAQQIALLDSMMRGISIGALTLWHRPRSESVDDALPLPGCDAPTHGHWGASLIVDGQQRATTLVLAALGRLDHWRWNGHEWTTGKGFLTPRLALWGGVNPDHGERMSWAVPLLDHPDKAQARLAFDEAERMGRTDLDLMSLGGTAEEMVETYRRLATHGSPHSPEDLSVMERWLAQHRGEETAPAEVTVAPTMGELVAELCRQLDLGYDPATDESAVRLLRRCARAGLPVPPKWGG